MPSFISAAVAALSLSSLASANVAYRRAEAFTNSSSSSTQLSTSSSSSSRSVPLGTGITTSGTPSSTAGAGVSQGSSANGTATSTGSSPSSTSTRYPTTFNGVSFYVEVDISYTGVEIDLAIVFAKRAGQTLDDCLSTCSANTDCAATAFNSNTTTCSFYSSFDKNTRTAAPGITFAQVTGRGNSSSSAPANNGSFPSTTQANNGTSVTASPNPGNNGTFPNVESIICPEYNDQVLQETDGSQYLIRCGLNIDGVILLTRKARMIRRQATFGNDWIVDCIDTCSATATCVGTSYNSQQGTCTFYSTVDALVADANTDSAILVNEAPAPGVSSSASLVPVVSTQTVTEGDVTRTITTTPLTTSTVYSTTTKTIQSCAPGVPCTAATVTEVVVAYTTVCPVSAYPTGANGGAIGGAVGGASTQTLTVCTACQYAPTTCPTGANGAPIAGKPTPVTTTVIQAPVLAGPTGAMTTSTVYQTQEHVTTTCGANGCGKATVTAVVSLYTTVCPASSGAPGAPGSQAPAPSAGSQTVIVPGTTVAASTKPAETIPAVVENGSTKPAETVPATVVPGSTKKPSTTIVQYTPTSSMVAYTGAAVKNGMGFAAMAAGVAALVL
ncbi:unnamed protein product [Aureobasidium uvarum]|uniref:Apple domain-containing protein n=1 Tax=Aureobasidium uvarum TaxID=2773716 RepID=A0A9N8KJA1_9PEZI|nr:unnamed protein product [Aureobasidium uvarum]